MGSIYVPATYGGIIDAASRSALTMSENDRFALSLIPPARDVANTVGSSATDGTPLREILNAHFGNSSAGATSGPTPDVNSVAGSSSVPEERTGLYQAAHAQPTRDGFAAAITDSMFGRDPSPTPDFDLLTDDTWGNSSSSVEGQHPPESMPAASTASSSAAASGSGPDVNNEPLNGAPQQIGDLSLGSSTGLPELTPGENWDLDDPGVRAFKRNCMGDDSSTTMAENGCMDPRVFTGGTDNSANVTVERAPAVPLAGPAQPAVTMDAGSSISNVTLPFVNGVNFVGGAQVCGQMCASNGANNCFVQDATFGRYTQQPQHAGVNSSANNPVAPNATFGGCNQPQVQMGVGKTATNFNFVAPQATPSGYMAPHMPMGAGSSIKTNFAAQQHFSVASNATFNGGQQQIIAGYWDPSMNCQQQMALNGGFQPFNPQVNAAPRAHPYLGAENTTPHNGVMGQYSLPQACQVGPAPGNCMGQQQQQQQALNGNTLPQKGQDWQAAAPQRAVPFAEVRIRRRQGDAGGSPKRRRTGPAPAVQAPAVQVLAAPAAPPAPAQQQVPAKEGPYKFTSAGVPNIDPTRKGNAQGQTPGWSQALKHHNGRCDRLKLDGCVPGCDLRKKWPRTWENWNTRRFQIKWEMERPGRPQEQLVSGFAVAAQGKFEERFVVLGEVQADGSVGKKGAVGRVDEAAVKE